MVFFAKISSWKVKLESWNTNHESLNWTFQISKSGQNTFFMFSLTFKAFVMSVTFLLFLCNFYIVLAREKATKTAFIEVFSRQKNPKQKMLYFTRLTVGG